MRLAKVRANGSQKGAKELFGSLAYNKMLILPRKE